MTGASKNSGEGRQSIWARPDRGTRGPAPAHSRETIVTAAIALADAEGLAAVSMRAVAAALGTSAASLYRYLTSRDDLLDLMIDRVTGELRPYKQREGDWLEAMLALAREQLKLYRRHVWLPEALQRAPAIGPHGLAWFDHCLHVLRPVRCPATAKFEAIAMMTGVVSLFARSEAAAGSASGFAGADMAAYPNIVAAFSQPPGPAPQRDLFERTLRSLLTGLLADES